jgi:hypothetical protein
MYCRKNCHCFQSVIVENLFGTEIYKAIQKESAKLAGKINEVILNKTIP